MTDNSCHIVKPIVFDGSHSRAKQVLFLIICSAWILPGLIGHDPWKPDEAVAFGIVRSMLVDAHWLLPHIAGQPWLDYPPLFHWVASLTAWLFAPLLPQHDGARLATGLFMAITLVYVFKAATRLHDERVGRMAVLILLGSIGLVWRGHQLHPEVAGMAGMAIALYGMTRLRADPVKGGLTTGIATAVVGLSVGLVAALAIPLTVIGMMALLNEWRHRELKRAAAYLLVTALLLSLLYPLALWVSGQWNEMVIPMLMHSPWADSSLRRGIEPLNAFNIALLGLPALPLAFWLWWQARRKWRDRIELALPLSAFVTLLLVAMALREAGDAQMLPLLLPLAIAASPSLERLPRALASFIDSFSLMLFGSAAAGMWLYWTAAITQIPASAAAAVARQAPGFTLHLNPIPFTIALVLTLVWLYAIIFAHRSNRRAIINWTAGFTLAWVLPNTLALDGFNHVLSYRQVASSLAKEIDAQPGCMIAKELGEAQRASFDYFAQLRVVSADSDFASQCHWLLTQGTQRNAPAITPEWRIAWQGARPGDRVELFRLYFRDK